MSERLFGHRPDQRSNAARGGDIPMCSPMFYPPRWSDRFGAIAIFLSVVFQAGLSPCRHDILLFHQLSTVHDDDLRHRWVLLPESVLSCVGRGRYGRGLLGPVEREPACSGDDRPPQV